MIKGKVISEIIVVMMVSASILGCSNQQAKKVINETGSSTSSSSESRKTEQTQQIQQAKQVPNANNSTNKKVVEETYYGQWQIGKVLAFGPVGTYNNDDIKAIVGRKLAFSKESGSCFGDQIDVLNNTSIKPAYKKSVIAKKDFEASNRITFDKLGIKSDSITEIDAFDANRNGCTLFIKDNNTLILYGGGIYFELNKI